MAREVRFEVRQTEEENAQFKAGAEEDGFPTVASWLRWLASTRLKEQKSAGKKTSTKGRR